MDLPYVDQSASGLRFYLVRDRVDVSPFTVIKETSFRWNHLDVDMGILGASHFLRINDRLFSLSEIFACATIEHQKPFVQAAPFPDLPSQIQVPFEHFLYRFKPRLVSWESGVKELGILRAAIARSGSRTRTYGLEHQFPSLPGDEETKPPLTLVYAKVGGQLTLKTAHCYPNEGQIVFTTTTLNKMKG